ncbi:MAG: hypothetical protein OEV44_08790 [Spirochaetota bacterium]|nr:hypothetical protein [Spirochaetota bacterium]
MKNQIKLVIILVLSIYVFIGCNKDQSVENEPNDTFKNANKIKLNSFVKGNFANLKDQDVYLLDLSKVSINNNEALSVSISKIKGFDVLLKIYFNKKLIKIVDDYLKNEVEKVVNLALQKGIYYIIVAPGRFNKLPFNTKTHLYKSIKFPTNNYTLEVSSRTVKNLELEPNDTPSDAIPIKINTPIIGYYSPFRNYMKHIKMEKPLFNDPKLDELKQFDFDWYSIIIPDAGSHNISVILDKTEHIDSILGVYSDKRIILMNSKGFSEGESIFNLTIEGQKKYYIVVIPIPHDYSATSENVYPYQLTVNKQLEKNLITESENNNEVNKATLITGNEIHGLLSTKDDLDYYKIVLKPKESDKLIQNTPSDKIKETIQTSKNDTKEQKTDDKTSNIRKSLSVSLSGIPNVDLELRLIDSKGQLINIYDNNKTGESEEINSYDVTNMNEIILLVKGGKKNKGENIKDYYKLSVKINNHDSSHELEPNDIYPNIIDVNKEIIGYINPKSYTNRDFGDVDKYKIRLKQGKKYKLSVTGIKGVDIEVKLLYRSLLKELEIKGDKKRTKSVKFESFVAPYDPDPETYYIEIKSKFGNTGNSNSPYILIIKEL